MTHLRNGLLFATALLLLPWPGCKGDINTGHGESPPATSATSLPGEAEVSEKDPDSAADNVLRLDERMMANIRTEELIERPTTALLRATGKVQFNEDRMARVLAPVSGQILNLRVKVGDTVRKGETLFIINSREVASAVDDYLESRKDLDLAEKTYAMTKDLFEHQAASRISLQQAESELVKARARVARNEEALRVLGVDVGEALSELSSRIHIRAPLSGTVIERHVTEGQFVQPDSGPLLVIADLSTVWVLADIFERDLRLVKVGQKAEVTTAAYPERRFLARVSYISDIVDPATRTVKVRFLVSNIGSSLKPEMFASVTLFVSESTPGLTVPAEAVFTEDGKNYAYVCVGERAFVRRQVEVLPDSPGRLKVISGLRPGDRIVSDGALLLHQHEARKG